MSKESDINRILGDLGLTEQESRVYLALLKLQESQTGNLCRITGIASSNIYNILDALMRKGLASYRVQNNIKVFMPAPPDALNELFLEKQKRLTQQRKEVTELIGNLKKQEIEEPQANYKYYEGYPAIKSLWYELMDRMDSRHMMRIYGGTQKGYTPMLGFYDEYHKTRKRKKVPQRLIIPDTHRELGPRRTDRYGKVGFLPLKNDAEWGVYDDLFFVFHYPVKKKPYGFMIKDKTIAGSFREVFELAWDKAEKQKN